MADINEVISLKKADKLEEARKLLLQMLEQEPNDPRTLLEAAFVHDQLGMAPQAITFYQQALDFGLAEDDRKGALLCLGSSYRAVGLYEQAKETLEIGMSEFPSCNQFYIFFAMTLYNLDEHDLAMEMVLEKLIETTGDQQILQYKKAIQFYASRLDETFN